MAIHTTSSRNGDTCRVHDTRAAHFLRHEVKNGVLAAIGIVESLKDSEKNNSNCALHVDPTVLSTHLTDLTKTLRELLDRTVDYAMTLELVHGDYGATAEPVDLTTFLRSPATSTSTSSRFPIVSSPEVPQLLLIDPNLIRTVHNNAISNACKFGNPHGIVATTLQYDPARQVLRMQVVNEPAHAQEQLRLSKLTLEEKSIIFQQHTLLDINNPNAHGTSNPIVAMSEGNGAWIMQNCAKALNGQCSIDFLPHSTILTLECPAAPVPTNSLVRPLDYDHMEEDECATETFTLPSNIWCIVVEDSVVQRKLLLRSLIKAGVPSERCLILGESPDEILEFVERTKKLISQHHKDDYFLVIMDEHLDIIEQGGTSVVSKTILGSLTVQKLREALEPSQESRLLALIRSANDSSSEQRRYLQRAHGFIPKGPIQHGNLMQVIRPHWQRRFQVPLLTEEMDTSEATAAAHPEKRRRVKTTTASDDAAGNSTSTSVGTGNMEASKFYKSMPTMLSSRAVHDSFNKRSNANACWNSCKSWATQSSLQALTRSSRFAVGKPSLASSRKTSTTNSLSSSSSSISASSSHSTTSPRSPNSSPMLRTKQYGHERLFFAKAG